MEIQCKICGQQFETPNTRRKVCSDECRAASHRAAKKRHAEKSRRQCVDCGTLISNRGTRCVACSGVAQRQGECIIEGCAKQAKAHGLCGMHIRRQAKGQQMEAPPQRVRGVAGSEQCRVPGCVEMAMFGWSRLCGMHHQRLKVSGDPGPAGPLQFSPKRKQAGERRTWIQDGYVWCWHEGRNRTQHAVVMEAHLGRSLVPGENVHHINGDRADNRIENLELWSSSQPSGQRVADKLAWAREILATYEPVEHLI